MLLAKSQLVSEILHISGVVLISWKHKAITEKIAPRIAGEQKIEDLPHEWNEARYDVVLRFNRISPEAPWSFYQLCGELDAVVDKRRLRSTTGTWIWYA
jgi:hypothetical protein